MLIDLYLMQTYFADPAGAVYEEDLVDRYGRREVSRAIFSGKLEHRRIPCGSGRTRCVCRLSEAGRREAEAAINQIR